MHFSKETASAASSVSKKLENRKVEDREAIVAELVKELGGSRSKAEIAGISDLVAIRFGVDTATREGVAEARAYDILLAYLSLTTETAQDSSNCAMARSELNRHLRRYKGAAEALGMCLRDNLPTEQGIAATVDSMMFGGNSGTNGGMEDCNRMANELKDIISAIHMAVLSVGRLCT